MADAVGRWLEMAMNGRLDPGPDGHGWGAAAFWAAIG
jgi:hypothetical protein